ncbi:TAF5-like RNA polymerase II p300/CBP-associated factor-associated factor 65 kDa subunit 5L [Bacillus rossius redtenbacheri]|uniref:TAF5-like RNA polymerase II p300/CBP-associated factor-associated factor 65 kDa subunit 5L n=1 Tax=Bacillus rossius redtenbacheri TaxID=93214 RepID=UPI002FDD63FD
MKQSRSEIISNIANEYLRRRGYMDASDVEQPRPAVVTAEEMVVSAAVSKDTDELNAILFSSSSTDILLVDQQYTKLKNWICIELNDEVWQFELVAILWPLFCHLYLEMLRGGYRPSVTKFFKRHEPMFATRENMRPLLKELETTYTVQEIGNKPLVQVFRSGKYRVSVSPAAMAALQRHLSKQEHMLLIQVLQRWFDFDMVTFNSVQEQDDEDLVELSRTAEKEQAPTGGSLGEHTEFSEVKEMLKLKEIIQWVHVSPMSPSPLRLYTVQSSENNVYCGSVSGSVEQCAVGFENEIRLWNIVPKRLCVPYSPPVRLACDTLEQPEPDIELTDAPSVSLRGHGDKVMDVLFVQEPESSELLLSVSYDTTMRAWRLADNTCAAVYRGHNYPIWCVASSVLGMNIATGSHDRTVRLWSFDRTFPLRVLAAHTMDVECVKFHPNGMLLASGSTDKTVRVWNVYDSKLVRILVGHKGAVQAVAFSPDGKHLASAGEDRRVLVWDLAAASVVAQFRGHSAPVTALCWTGDSELLASCARDGSVRVWNAKCYTAAKCKPFLSTPDICKYSLGCSSMLTVQYTQQNSLVCVGVK